MHWDEVLKRLGSSESGASNSDEEHSGHSGDIYKTREDNNIPQGDETLDTRPPEALHPDDVFPWESVSPQGRDHEESENSADKFLRVPMPTNSTGITTFAYGQALRNRIHDAKLGSGGVYDVKVYKPTFIYDCLMLPGSLANVLGKDSQADIIHRMTPALLPSFKACVNGGDQHPCLLHTQDSNNYVQGMVIFGQGKASRDRVHEHYRPHHRRQTFHVEIDVIVPSSTRYQNYPSRNSQLQRRKISAHVWLPTDVHNVDVDAIPRYQRWTIEDYLAGNLAIYPAVMQPREPSDATDEDSDEDGYGSVEADDHHIIVHHTNEPVANEEVQSSYGTCDHERRAAFMGW